MNDVAQLMRAANPVPDSQAALTDDEFNALLLLTQSRSGNVEVQELTKPVEPKKKQRRGWLVAAAAFAAVIVVIGAAMFLANPAEEVPPATTPSTTQAVTPTTVAAIEEGTATTVVQVVEAEPVMTPEVLALIGDYEAAFSASDEAAFRAIHSEDARTVDPSNVGGNSITLDRMVDEMMNLRVQESTLEIEGCTATSSGARCDFVYSGVVEDALFDGSITNSVALRIESGRISEHGLTVQSVQGDPWQQVLDWVEENFPEDREEMVLPNLRDILAYEDSELWLEYAPLWAEAGRP